MIGMLHRITAPASSKLQLRGIDLNGGNPSNRYAILLTLLSAGVMIIGSHGRSTPYNNYQLLADALRHGHTWIDWPGPYIDALSLHGRHWIIEGPMPALLMVPFPFVPNQTIFSEVAGVACVPIAWSLLTRLGLDRTARILLTGFLFAGTDLWWCAQFGDVWLFAHVCAVLFTLLAMRECFRSTPRCWLVAVYAFSACESRSIMALAIPMYVSLIFYTLRYAQWRAIRSALGSFLLVCAAGAAFSICWNEIQYRSPLPVGYTLWYQQDPMGDAAGQLFALRYVPYQLHSFFVEMPTLIHSWPYLRPEQVGQSLTFTSPALVLALRSYRNASQWVVLPIAATVLVVFAFDATYYVNGFIQFGMRHALDFEPFAFVLMAFSVRGGFPLWGRVLCVWSMLVGAWGVWYWQTFYRIWN